LFVKQAEEWSQQMHHNLYPNTHADVMISPILTETSSEARVIEPERRNCLFWNEKSTKYSRLEGFPYNKLNCLTHCQHRHVVNYCNCSMTLYFPEIRKKHNFNYLKAPRQDEYMNEGGRGMVCDCIDNCKTLLFLVNVNTQPIHSLPTNVNGPLIYVHIYYNRKSLTKYSARLRYSYLNLAAYIGGVFGLFWGASMLNLAEICYAI
uniref:Uncharacterized protein n=1 Tax=Musca domestica TaxID=7370 RepID=A0A1I8N5F9_MUSDO